MNRLYSGQMHAQNLFSMTALVILEFYHFVMPYQDFLSSKQILSYFIYITFTFFIFYFTIPPLYSEYFEGTQTLQSSIEISIQPKKSSEYLETKVQSKLANCLHPIGQFLPIRSTNQKLSFLDKEYHWKELWLSTDTVSYLMNTTKNYFLENGGNVINYSDFELVLKNLHPKSRSHFNARIGCQRCVVVGNGGCLRGRNLGPFIDSFPVVIRINKPPLEDFETTVGSKTDIRFLYPESSPSEKTFFKGEGFVVVVPFKRDDYLWAATMANQSLKLHLTDFWSREPPPKYLPVEPEKILIVNPNITESIFKHLNARATTGLLSIVLSLNFCESVYIAGFCYKTSVRKNVVNHYYSSQKLTNHLTKVKVHAFKEETQIISEMKNLNLVTDLTS